jgi:hypothetical protein
MDTREMLIEADARRVADLTEQLRAIATEHNWPLVCMTLVSNGEDGAAGLGSVVLDGQTMGTLLQSAGPLGFAVVEAARSIDAASKLMKAQMHFAEVSGNAPCECPDCVARRVEEKA